MNVAYLDFHLANQVNSAYENWYQNFTAKITCPEQKVKTISRASICSVAKKLSHGDPNSYNSALIMAILAPKIDPQIALGSNDILSSMDSLDITGTRISVLFHIICERRGADAIRLVRAAQMGIIEKETLLRAIDNGEKLDVEDIVAKVKDELK